MSITARIRSYFGRHAQNFLGSLGRLVRHPFASLMTITVIGIALALPAALYVLVKNGKSLSGGWEDVADLSAYLDLEISASEAEQLARELRVREDVGEVEVIPADAALEEFRDHSGFAPALDALPENPLPTVLVIRPAPEHSAAAQVEALRTEVASLPQVDLVQVDTEWVSRFNAILDVIRRIVTLAAGLFAIGVVVIVGNTIRLDIENRRVEIEVEKLVGASDRFIRRPFLYTGLWYGLGGAMLALVGIQLALLALQGPASRLAGMYGSGHEMIGLGPDAAVALLGGGALLGWFGAWLASSRHLREIEPTNVS